ncbi:MAG: hypothetical protein E7Z75_05560 [Methanobrevibacter olleyae]|uniref:Uncharacterized protein n=1 Tax=Methanobrevibacter olleyae TaxID=294671 RepID=A0A8T3VY18_METOL|nr:hypothetical protein [Methanobrevibacter olleyae]
MDGMEIINSFKKETIYEFSEAIPILNDRIYIIFKIDIISIDMNPSKTRIKKIKERIKNNENAKNLISHMDIEPIAYLLKTEKGNEYDYQMESIDEKYDSFVEKNKNELLEKFLEDNPI